MKISLKVGIHLSEPRKFIAETPIFGYTIYYLLWMVVHDLVERRRM